jgi:hypothetical protein
VRVVADECGISVGLCHTILTEKLDTHRVAAMFVLQLLTDEQKEQHVAMCQELLHRANNEKKFLKNIVMGDETWVYRYNVETKRQSSQWTSKSSLRPKNACQVRSNVKVMLIIFFGYKSVVHHEFVPKGHTVNKEFYLEVLRREEKAQIMEGKVMDALPQRCSGVHIIVSSGFSHKNRD